MLSHSGQNRNRGSDNFYKVSIDTSVVQDDLFHGDGIEIWVSKPEMAFGPKCALIRKKPFGGCILLKTLRWGLLTTSCRQIPTWILWDNQEHLWIGIASHSVFLHPCKFLQAWNRGRFYTAPLGEKSLKLWEYFYWVLIIIIIEYLCNMCIINDSLEFQNSNIFPIVVFCLF